MTLVTGKKLDATKKISDESPVEPSFKVQSPFAKRCFTKVFCENDPDSIPV